MNHGKTKLFFSLILLFLSIHSLKSQIFISGFYFSDIFVGPKNVMFVNDEIKEFYINDLEFEINVIEKQKDYVDSLQNLTYKSKSDKRYLDQIKKEKLDFKKEIRSLKFLLREWQEFDLSLIHI